MPTVAELLLRIGADVRGFTRGLEEASQGVEQTLARMGTSIGGLTAAAVAVSAAGAGLSGFLIAVTREAAAAAEEQIKLAAAIQRSQQSIDPERLIALASALAGVTRFSDEAVIGVQRLLVQFGATEGQVERLTPLILDIARAFDRDVASTAEAVGRALAGSEGALSRFIGLLPDGSSLSEDFGAAVGQLEARFGGFARAAGQTLPDALLRLRNAIGDLLESLGAPIVGPVQAIVDGLVRLVVAVRDTVDAVPGLATGIAIVVGLAAAFTLLVGAALALGAGLTFFSATIVPAVVVGLGLIGGAIAALVGIIIANPIGALIVVGLVALVVLIPAVIANFNRLVDAFRVGFVFLTTLAAEFGGAIIDLLNGLGSFNLDQVQAAVQRMRTAFDTASAAAAQYQHAQEAIIPVSERLREGQLNLKKTLEQIGAEFERASRRAELFALEQQRLATEGARRELSRPGLNEQQLRDIQDRLARRQSQTQERLLQDQIVADERRLQETLRTAGRGSKAVEEVEKSLAQKRADLSRTTLEQQLRDQDRLIGKATEREDKIFEIERDAAAKRIAVQRATEDARVSLLQASLEAQRQIEGARVDLESAARQASVDQFRLNEETRLGLFRRAVELERTLGAAIIGIRTSLAQQVGTRELQVFEENEARRAQLLRSGAIDQDTAARQSAQERLELEIATATRSLEIEEARLGQIDAQRRVERALLVAEAQSRIAVLQAETEARAQQLETNQRLREIDLAASLAIARAETRAKIVELKAQTDAQVAEARRSLALQQARGLITPGEAARQAAAISDIERAAAIQSEALLDAQRIREETTGQQLVLSRQAVEEAKQAIQRESATRQEGIERQLAQDLIRVDAETAQARVAVGERLLGIEQQILSARNAITALGTIPFALPQAEEVLERLRTLQSRVASDAASELGRLEALYGRQLDAAAQALSGFSTRGAKMLEVVGNQIRTTFLVPTDGLATAERSLSGFVDRSVAKAGELGEALRRALSPSATAPVQVPVALSPTAEAAVSALRFLLGQSPEFGAAVAGLAARLAPIAAAYASMASAIVASVGKAIEAIQRLIDLQRSIPAAPPQTPRTPGAPPPTPRAEGGPAVAAAATNVTVPVVIDGQVVGRAVLRFIDGQLASHLAATPGV